MDDPERPDERPAAGAKAWAALRLALGLAQMMGSVVSFYLLLQTGINELTLSAIVLTCLFTTVSVLLFGRRGPAWRPRPGRSGLRHKGRKDRVR